jgi:hypothetical protein
VKTRDIYSRGPKDSNTWGFKRGKWTSRKGKGHGNKKRKGK